MHVRDKVAQGRVKPLSGNPHMFNDDDDNTSACLSVCVCVKITPIETNWGGQFKLFENHFGLLPEWMELENGATTMLVEQA